MTCSRADVDRLGPAVRRHASAAHVDRDEHLARPALECALKQVRVGERGGARDHALGPGPQNACRSPQGAQAAAELDGHVQLVGDAPEMIDIGGRALARAVEVDDVQAARSALTQPRAADRGSSS